MRQTNQFSRRQFLGSATALLAAGTSAASLWAAETQTSAAKKKIVVGADPWVYAATLPNRDITPVLPAIFADMEYAGMEGIELMPIVLQPVDAVQRIGELSQKHHLPIIGALFEGKMFDRTKHAAILEMPNW